MQPRSFSPYAARAPELCPRHDAPFTSKRLVRVCGHRVCECPWAQVATYACGCTINAIPDDQQPRASRARLD